MEAATKIICPAFFNIITTIIEKNVKKKATFCHEIELSHYLYSKYIWINQFTLKVNCLLFHSYFLQSVQSGHAFSDSFHR